MMHQTFVKPMSADYARFVVTAANNNNNSQSQACTTPAATDSKRRSRSFSLFKSRRHDSASMGLRATAGSTATSVATVAADTNDANDDESENDSNSESDNSMLRKKVWWRQLVLSQSLPAMLNAPTRR